VRKIVAYATWLQRLHDVVCGVSRDLCRLVDTQWAPGGFIMSVLVGFRGFPTSLILSFLVALVLGVSGSES
jgi:hypothetical protein